MNDFTAEFATYCDTFGEPERIELMLCDLNAVMRGKWLPSGDVSKLTSGQVRLPLSTYAPNIYGEEVEETGLGILVGDPDGILTPISGTLTPVPWANGNVAQVMVEMLDKDGEISALSPRNILKNLLSRFKSAGLHPVVASELEFYIVQKREDAADAPLPPVNSPDAQNYDLEVLAAQEDILNEIQSGCAALNLPIDTLIAEFGPGQFEINFHHTDDVLAAADIALIFRRLVRGVVANHDFEATFMAKPYADFPGNGMHLHASILDDNGNNIFATDNGVHPRLLHAVGGVLETMRDLQAIFAPHANSYRRFQPNSFAPCAPDWGIDNRNAGIRLPETTGKGARLEHRICGADVNPYLAFAGILGGILHGLQNETDVPLPLDDPDTIPAKPLTPNWDIAIERFENAESCADIFGVEYRATYAAVRRDEMQKITRAIPAIEYSTYLSRL